MFRFSIRDVLWLMVVVALAVSWWLDNKRIENSVAKLAEERQLLQADFEDRMAVLNELQLEQKQALADLHVNGVPFRMPSKKGRPVNQVNNP